MTEEERERPIWLEGAEEPDSPFTPKDLRAGLCQYIYHQTAGKVEGIVMDCAPGEDPLDCFNRLENNHDIDNYFFIVPWNSKMHGTEWEGGMLARDFKYGRYPAINLFLDTAFSSVDDDGARNPRFQEGQRTRYLNSLVHLAHSVRWWRDYENLADQVAMTARAIFDDFLAE